MRQVKTTLQGRFFVDWDNAIYKESTPQCHQMVLGAPLIFKEGDRVQVTVELLKRPQRVKEE